MKSLTILALFAATVFSVQSSPHPQEKSECLAALEEKSTEAANKALVLELFEKAFGNQDQDYDISQYVGEPYIQHNPLLENGREAVQKMAKQWLKEAPQGKLDIKRTAAEGDLVWVHQKLNFLGKISSVMDIFRIENGKIVEHWDAIQQCQKNPQIIIPCSKLTHLLKLNEKGKFNLLCV